MFSNLAPVTEFVAQGALHHIKSLQLGHWFNGSNRHVLIMWLLCQEIELMDDQGLFISF